MTKYIVTVYRNVRYTRDIEVEASTLAGAAEAADFAKSIPVDQPGWSVYARDGMEVVRRADGEPTTGADYGPMS